MLPRRSVVEDSNGGVDHLVIANHEQAWIVDSLLHIVHRQSGMARQAGKVLLDEVNELLVFNGARAYDDDVLAKERALVEVCDHVASDVANVIDVAKNRLSHHVIPEHVEVNVFH